MRFSAYDGTGWSAEDAVANGVSAILETDLAYDGTTATYVYSVDADGDLTTVTDQDLYSVKWDGTTLGCAHACR